MSQARKKISKHLQSKGLQVPLEHSRGVGSSYVPAGTGVEKVRGADSDAVVKQSHLYGDMMQKAGDSYEDARAGLQRRLGEDQDFSTGEYDDELYAGYADVIEAMQNYQRELDHGDDVVSAPFVDAFMRVDPATRAKILDRAGNPSAFDSLREALDEGVEYDADTSEHLGYLEQIAGASTGKAAGNNISEIKKLEHHFRKPGGKGNLLFDKNIRTHADDRTALTRDPSSDDMRKAQIRAISGSVGSQSNAIENRLLKKAGLSQDQIDALSVAERNQIFANHPEAPRLQSVGDDTIAGRNVINTNPDIENLVSINSMRPKTQRVLEMLYDASNYKSAPINSADPVKPSSGIIDIDEVLPWWRARPAELDVDGNLAYPPRMLSAEAITGFVEDMYGVNDPDFFNAILPVIQRSIDAAPDRVAPRVDKDGNVLRPKSRTAEYYQDQVYSPDEMAIEMMQGGVGSGEYPYPLYGTREIERPEIPNQQQTTDQRPQSGDSASIFKVRPPTSPISQLLA